MQEFRLLIILILIQQQARLELFELEIVLVEFERRLLRLCSGLELVYWREDYT